MKSRRHCLLPLAWLVIALPHAAAGAQAAAAAAPPESGCKLLSSESAPALPESDAASKRLVDCGYELAGQNDYADAGRVFEQAIEMTKRRGDRRSLAAALNGYGGVLFTLGDADRAEPLLVESARLSEEIGDK